MKKRYKVLVGITVDVPHKRYEPGKVIETGDIKPETLRALLSIVPPVLEEVTEDKDAESGEE